MKATSSSLIPQMEHSFIDKNILQVEDLASSQDKYKKIKNKLTK
jgi:hypothetical protein